MINTTLKKIIIYYFSGTGNAFAVSNWIKQVAEEQQINIELKNISKLSSRKEIVVDDNSLVGIVSPTHGFNFPPIMFPVDLPSNWISIHPGLKGNVVRSIFQKRELQTKVFANQILTGKRNFKALWDLIQDLAITPVSVLYYLAGRFVLAKSFIASSKCNNCNLCVRECPVNAIKIIDNKPYWTFNCESCMRCMNRCPQRAIETAHGYIIGLFLIVNFFIIKWIYHLTGIDKFLNGLPVLVNKLISMVLYTLVVIIFIKLTYRLQHYLLRFKFYENLIVYTSLTRYPFWRRYKPPRLK